MTEPDEHKKRFANLAKRHGLSLSKEGTKLGDHQINLSILYASGSSLTRLLTDGTTIAFAQAGSGGEFVSVLRAEELLKLLECEQLLNSHVGAQAA